MKLLFTSVGRRVELLQAFRDAARRLSMDLTIIGADVQSSAPALCFCDETVISPRISDSSYIPFLTEYCRKNGIDCLIPTIDTDLLLLAAHRNEFRSTKVLISAEDKIALCRDKRMTAEYLHHCGLKSPMPVDDVDRYRGGYPAFIKPLDGSSSINAYRVDSETVLRDFAARIPGYIIQPYIEGTEYTVDLFCDFDGKPIYITPRVRLAVRAGEVLKTRIDLDSAIIDEMKCLAADFKPCGQITVQLIKETRTGDNYYIEINPRFGGGAPLSMKAGADSAEALLRLLSGQTLSFMPDAAENGAVFCRYDQSVRIDT